MDDPRKIFLLGDTHANSSWIQVAVQTAAHQGAEAILQLGDFAYADLHRARFLETAEVSLARHGLHLFWIDGNHDDHEAANADPLNPETGLRDQTEHIHFIPRGHRWEWNGVKFLGLGGAYSIDRDWRQRRGAFWSPDETITEEEARRACEGGEVDIMVAHDVPWGVLNCYGPGTGGGDKDRWPESLENRKVLRSVVDVVRPRLLVHGHCHHRNSFPLRLEDGFVVQVEGFDRDDQGPCAWEMLEIAPRPVVLPEEPDASQSA